MLESVQKATEDGHPDHVALEQAIQGFKALLNEANHVTGIRDNRFKLDLLYEQLVNKADFPVRKLTIANCKLTYNDYKYQYCPRGHFR